MHPFKWFYNPNVSLYLLVEHVYYHTDILSGKIKYGAKSFMICLAYKVGYSALKLKSIQSLYPCFSHDNGEIGLNSY